jgi:hypothetical protein
VPDGTMDNNYLYTNWLICQRINWQVDEVAVDEMSADIMIWRQRLIHFFCFITIFELLC